MMTPQSHPTPSPSGPPIRPHRRTAPGDRVARQWRRLVRAQKAKAQNHNGKAN